MTFSVFRSTDPGAPSLTGVAGSLLAVLDKCLVDGYTVVPWVADDTYTLGQAARPTTANGLWYKVTTAGDSDLTEPTWPTTTGATVTDGTVVWTCLGPIPLPLGWTKAYTGTNKTAYRMNPTGSTGSYVRVKDDYTTTNQMWASITGFVAMTGIDTGTDPFNMADYCGVRKSTTQDTVARAWVLVGDEKRFYLMTQPADVNAADWDITFFGDIISYVPNDTYGCLQSGRYSSSISSMIASSNYTPYMYHYSFTGYSGITMPRNHAGVGPFLSMGFHTDSFKAGANTYNAFIAGSQGPLSYPSVNGGIFMAPVWVHQSTTSPYVVRGHMPGYWVPLHNRPLANNDIFTGSGSMAGKVFEAFHTRSTGQVLIEISNTWS